MMRWFRSKISHSYKVNSRKSRSKRMIWKSFRISTYKTQSKLSKRTKRREIMVRNRMKDIKKMTSNIVHP